MSTLGEEAAIDEALRESFPASDAPAWTGSHAGMPTKAVERPRLLRDVVQQLRDDYRFVNERPRYALECFGRLDVPAKSRDRNVEAVLRGQREPRKSIVIGAVADTDVAVLFHLARAFANRAFDRTLRLVVLDDAAQYVDELLRSGPEIHAMVSLERLGCGSQLRLWRARRIGAHRLERSFHLTDIGRRAPCDFERLGVIAQSVERIAERLVHSSEPNKGA